MGETDVIINELKHINARLDKMEQKQDIVNTVVIEMQTERKFIKWGVPLLSSAIAWFFGQGGR